MGFTFGSYEDTPRIKLFDKWINSCGYILSRRAADQPLASNYANSALLKELIDNCPITTVPMNGQRFRSGKLCKKVSADTSVRWLVDTFTSFSKQQGKNIMIVPVMINYDRKFEANNIAVEMVSGVKQDYTLSTAMQKIYGTGKDQLG
jgi:glycerol-3-phosphate O-acyltransferase